MLPPQKRVVKLFFLSYDEIVKRIFSFVFIILFFLFFTPKAFATLTCSPSISRDPTNSVVITLKDTPPALERDGTELTINVSNGPTQTGTINSGVITYNLGKLDPGQYIFSLLAGNRIVCDPRARASFRVPTIDTCSPNVQLDPTTSQTILSFTSNQPEGSQMTININNGPTKTATVQNKTLTYNIGILNPGTHTFSLLNGQSIICDPRARASFVVANFGQSTNPTPAPAFLPFNCVEGLDKEKKVTTDKSSMVECTKIDTALGAFDITPQGFIKKIFALLLSLSGGVAIILIMISGYRLMSSQGNPEKVQAAREQLTSAIVGLLFIIFSVTILQIIGVDILHIPGLK